MIKIDTNKQLKVTPNIYLNPKLEKKEASILYLIITQMNRKISIEQISEVSKLPLNEVEEIVQTLIKKDFIRYEYEYELTINFYEF